VKVLIKYFSGTGNTKAVAEGYQSILVNHGHSVQCSSIEQADQLPEHDLLIIGGPIYAGNMPDKLISWVRKHIKPVSSKTAIVYSTSAGLLNANGVTSIGKKLIGKGYQIVDLQTFELPRNFYLDKYDPTPIEIQSQQFYQAGIKIVESVQALQQQETIKITESTLMIDILADVFRIMAKSLGKSYKIHEHCIGCGKCERDCPQHNIDYRTKTYHNRCIMCTRCLHNCPVNAISYKDKFIEQYRVQYPININTDIKPE